MPLFRLHIDALDAQFDGMPLYEIGGILRDLGMSLMEHTEEDQGTLRDAYGNVVGEWVFNENEY